MGMVDEAKKTKMSVEKKKANTQQKNPFDIAQGKTSENPFDVATKQKQSPFDVAEQTRQAGYEIPPGSREEPSLTQPWIDPIDAIAGPLALTRKLGTKAVAKAIPASLASEPVVGGMQALVDKWSGETLPEPVKIPVNMLTGLVVGDILATGAKQAGRLAKIRPKAGSFKGRKARKSEALRSATMEDTVSVDTGISDFLPRSENIKDFESAVKTIRGVPDNIMSGWFRQGDRGYKPKLYQRITQKPEVRESGLRVMHKIYQDIKDTKIPYDEFLNQDITLYRGNARTGDVFDSFSIDPKMAKKFGDVEEITVKPKDTLGSYQTTAEGEVLVPKATQGKTKGPIKTGDDLPYITEKSITRQLGEGAAGIYTKYIGSPVWDKLVMKHIPKMLEKVPGGKAINRAAIYDYRGDLPQTKEFMQMREQMERGMGVGQEYAVDLGNRLQKFPEKDQLKLGEYIRGERTELPKNLKQVGDEVKDTFYKLGKEAVDTGLLDESTFFKNAGRYMPRLYSSKEYQKKLSQFGLKKPERLDLSRFQKRKDIPKEIREEMGEILTPGFPVAKGVGQLTSDIQRAKFFKGIANNQDWARTADEAAENTPENFKQLPKSKKLGKLSEAYVHPEIHKELEDVAKTIELPEKVWRKALGSWKFGKVILSPKTHMRNVFSNSILAHLGGMPMTAQPRYMSLAAEEMAKKGEYWKQAKKTGLLDSTFIEKEMGQLFDQISSNMKGVKANSIPETLGAFGKGLQGLKTAGNKAADLYQAEEGWFKLGKFIHNIEQKGMNPEDAAKDAEKWLFNYGKLTRFQDKYRRHPLGAPFATFTVKSLPRIAEAATKYPWRFAAPLFAMQAVEEVAQQRAGDTEEQEEAKRELLPKWMSGQTGPYNPNFLRVPVTDQNNRDYYLNLTYMLPWGDIGEGGGFMGIPGGLRPMSQPGVSELAQQIGNYDFFWEEPIVKDTETAGKENPKLAAAKERLGHAYQHFAPTIARDVEKGISAFRGEPDYRGRTRPGGVVAADVFGGVKMYPVDYAERVSRLVSEKNPKSGWIARKLSGEIKTLAVKKDAANKAGNESLANDYQEKIDKKIEQIEGLAEETAEIGKTYKKAIGKQE